VPLPGRRQVPQEKDPGAQPFDPLLLAWPLDDEKVESSWLTS